MIYSRCLPFAAVLLVTTVVSAYAADGIQVYNAEIAKVGQWTFQLHNNYAFIGRKEPDFPGGLIPNHALQRHRRVGVRHYGLVGDGVLHAICR